MHKYLDTYSDRKHYLFVHTQTHSRSYGPNLRQQVVRGRLAEKLLQAIWAELRPRFACHIHCPHALTNNQHPHIFKKRKTNESKELLLTSKRSKVGVRRRHRTSRRNSRSGWDFNCVHR
jgi:hypothetical protein